MALPESKTWLVDGFCRFTHRMVSKRFTSFGVQLAQPIEAMSPPEHSLVVFANHIGWWDPIVAMLLRKAYFPDRTFYAPIDAKALEAYGVFRKLGFYGLELETFQGAADFLRTSREILASPKASLWITPEGRFVDCRDHAQPLMPGLAHLAASTPSVPFVPLAIEYPFWEEAKPSILVRLGHPITFTAGQSKSECGRILHASLRTAQEELARDVIARRSDAFRYLIAPRGMRNSWYDTARAWRAWFHGKPFDPRHAEITQQTRP
jgi:1-acyl-sn-glycerol-3-phosphate acyltransferase